MLTLPIITRINVDNYGLFPGAEGNDDFQKMFEKGLTLIVGVNGLGKTTLVTMILRAITGPYDLTGSGVPTTLEAVLPEGPKRLQKPAIDFFAQRVADSAVDARVTLSAKFGSTPVIIVRSLDNLSLVSFSVAGKNVELPSAREDREKEYQSLICELFDLSSFVDVLLVLHHIVFFTDKQFSALWDANAQRHILRAIFLDKNLARKVAESEREFQRFDSRFRNTRAQMRKFERQLNDAISAEESSPKIRSKLKATTSALAGLTSKAAVLESRLDELDENRRSARLEVEKAKIEKEQASGAIERAKYSALMHMFPKMQDAARLLMSRILADEGCLVCGSAAAAKKDELEKLLKNGYCPACGSDPSDQTIKAPAIKFEKAKMDRALKSASIASKELEASRRNLDKLSADYDSALMELTELRSQIVDFRSQASKLAVQLPTSSERVRNLQSTVDTMTQTMKAEHADSLIAKKKYGEALSQGREGILSAERKLSARFSHYISALMAEDARLVRIVSLAKVAQSGDHFEVSAFVPEMTAANRPGLTRRQSLSDVSQSERELSDLAFRLALIDTSAGQKSSSFLMETPEASLDGIAMNRVGNALCEYANSRQNRLIVTSNLTNAGMITAMFGGKARTKKEKENRRTRVVNLLDEAAPNQALLRNRKAYDRLLEDCLTGI